ncbi:hypothetical protein ACFL4T_01940 [candidate division KSB1 bacterium]
MCDHSKIEYIGIQETMDEQKPLFLYRCLICGTTVALKERNINSGKIKKKIVE